MKEQLKNVRALLEQGWTRGAFRKGNCYCLLGAIMETVPLEDRPAVCQTLAWNLGCRDVPSPSVVLMDYNDHNTKDDVLNLIDRTLEKL